MAATGQVIINIIGDATQLRKALSGSEQEMTAFQKKMQSVGESLTKIGKNMTIGVTVPIVAAGVASVKAASDLEQSIGATESVFGDAIDTVNKYAKQSVNAVGLSERAYRELAAVAGAQLQNLGVSQEDSAKQANKLIKIGADLAATFGGTTKDAVDALGAAFRGEADPAERFGLRLNINTANAKAVALGLAESTSKVSDFARQQAIMALIVEQSRGALGQFARESDTLAVQMQKARAELENAGAQIGAVLLPIMASAAGVVADLAQGFASLPANVRTVIVVLAGLAAAAGPVLVVTGAIIRNYQTLATVAPAAAKGISAVGIAVGAFTATYTLTTKALDAVVNDWRDDLEKLNKSQERYAKAVGAAASASNGLLIPSFRAAVAAYQEMDKNATTTTAKFAAFKDIIKVNHQAGLELAASLKDQPKLYALISSTVEKATRKQKEHAEALDDVKASAADAEDSLRSLNEFVDAITESGIDMERATLRVNDALTDLFVKGNDATTSQGDLQGAVLDVKESILAYGQTVESSAELAGKSVQDSVNEQKFALGLVAGTLAPGSELRVWLEQYIERLGNIPTQVATKLTLEQALEGYFGDTPPSFDGGGIVPGPPGKPILILAHGQETVRTPPQEAALAAATRGGDTYYITAPSPEEVPIHIARRKRADLWLAGR